MVKRNGKVFSKKKNSHVDGWRSGDCALLFVALFIQLKPFEMHCQRTHFPVIFHFNFMINGWCRLFSRRHQMANGREREREVRKTSVHNFCRFYPHMYGFTLGYFSIMSVRLLRGPFVLLAPSTTHLKTRNRLILIWKGKKIGKYFTRKLLFVKCNWYVANWRRFAYNECWKFYHESARRKLTRRCNNGNKKLHPKQNAVRTPEYM